MKFSSDGLTDQTLWRTLSFPANTMAARAGSPPSTEINGFLLFSNGAANVLTGGFTLPADWAAGTSIYPHVSWQKPVAGAGTVEWDFDYEVVPVGDSVTLPVNGTTISSNTTTTTDDDTVNHLLVTNIGEIALGSVEIGTMLLWQLSRDYATDTYANGVRLLSLDIHYEANGFGARDKYEK